MNKKVKNMQHYCYLITNILNNKIYIGVSCRDPEIRFKEHVKVSNYSNDKYKNALQKAIKKYGFKNFKVEIINTYKNAKLAYLAEIDYIKKYNSRKYGYNESSGGDCGPINLKFNKKQLISIINDFCNGINIRKIAAKNNLTYSTIFDITRLRISKTYNLSKKLLEKLKFKKDNSKVKKKITKKLLINIVNDYLNNIPMIKISKKYNVSINTIWNNLHRNTNSDIILPKGLNKKLIAKINDIKYGILNEKNIANITNMLIKKITKVDIGKHFNVSATTIDRFIKKYKIKI